jgi:protein SCO1/2
MNFKNSRKTFLLLFILIFPSAFYVYLTAGKERSFVLLPYYGPKHPIMVNNKMDTVYYGIPPFNFTNQNGNNISSLSLIGRIWVCCFEHLNDKMLAPSQAILMNRIEERTDRDSALRIITFALDSETSKSLSAYAQMVHAGKRQYFLSGGTGKVSDFAINAFYQPVDSSFKNGFIHFFLIDREGHIRGIYNGLHVKETDQLIDNISMLEAAYYVQQNREEGKKSDDDGGAM